MTIVSSYTNQAISQAANGDWEEAKNFNEKILEIEPANIGALNRLGFCFMQLGQNRKAKECYEKVLGIERFNPIAAKYLSLMKSKIQPQLVSTKVTSDFIEEPGRTKSVSLVKLTDPPLLQATVTATPCEFVVKNHRVDVVTTQDKKYLGCLPDDIAFRLQRLIASGNTYSVFVQSTSKKNCTVFIKEIYKSPLSPFGASFQNTGATKSIHQEDILLDEAPLDIRETGDEVESNDFEESDSTE